MAKHYDRYYCGKCHTTLKLDPATIKANLAKLQQAQAAKKKNEEDAAAGGKGGKDAKKAGKAKGKKK